MIGDIFRNHGDAYIEAHESNIPLKHVKVIRAIQRCKTSACGVNVSACRECGRVHSTYRSCGDRNCPVCQHRNNLKWLDKRLGDQLPGPYFMITFTIPEELRSIVRSAQGDAYGALFRASSTTLKELIANPKHVGGDTPGFFGVLHTWGRQLQYHPHIHYVVPGGALRKRDRTWVRAREGFLVPVHALSKVFRGKFRDEARRLGLERLVAPDVWRKAWNVNSQYVPGGAEGTLKYLAPYVFRPGITNARIVAVDDDEVTFKYKKSKSRRWRTITLNVFEFIRRFLQHVLPTGFMKIRYYGFMGAGNSVPHEELAILIEIAHDFQVRRPKRSKPPETPTMRCPKCGGELKLAFMRIGEVTIRFDTG